MRDLDKRISVQVDDAGEVWLHLRGTNGRMASINVSASKCKFPPLVEAAIGAWCEAQRAVAQAVNSVTAAAT